MGGGLSALSSPHMVLPSLEPCYSKAEAISCLINNSRVQTIVPAGKPQMVEEGPLRKLVG